MQLSTGAEYPLLSKSGTSCWPVLGITRWGRDEILRSRILRIEGSNVRLKLARILNLTLNFSVQVYDVFPVVVGCVASLLHAIPVHSNLLTICVIGVDILLPAPLMRGHFPMPS